VFYTWKYSCRDSWQAMDSGLDFVQMVLSKLAALGSSLRQLEDRVSVLEERTLSHENRLEDVEQWREQVEDSQED